MRAALVASASTAAAVVGFLLGRRLRKRCMTTAAQKERLPVSSDTRSLGTGIQSPSTFVGSGHADFVDGDGALARFRCPCGIAVDGDGNFLVADCHNNAVRKVTAEGVVTTLAGRGDAGFVDGAGAVARFNHPYAIAADGDGNCLVADGLNHAIRKVTADGVVTTLAGRGDAGFVDGAGAAALFNGPCAIAADGNGNFVVADSVNHAIRKMTTDGVVTTLAGRGDAGFVDGDGTAARFNGPCDIAFGGDGSFVVADNLNNAIRKVTAEGVVTTLAGRGDAGFVDGDGTAALFYGPCAVAVDGDGNFLVSDGGNHAIRKVTPFGSVSTLAVTGYRSHRVTVDLCGNIVTTRNNGLVRIMSGHVPYARRSFVADMYEMMNDATTADVLFVVGEGQVEIRSHGVLLQHRSEYFQKMLRSRFVEGTGEPIYLPETSPRAFRAMLAHLYTGALDVEGDIVIEVAQLADQFLLRDLTEQCVAYCQLHIDVSNVALWLGQSDKYRLAALRAKCLDYLCSNLGEIKSKMPLSLRHLTAPVLLDVVMRT